MLREPLVRTFPAYAFGLLRRAAAERGEPSPRLLTGPEQDLIIRELLDVVGAEPDGEPDDDPVGWPADLRPALGTRAFAAQLRDLLMRAEYVAVLALRDVANRGSVAYDPAELVRAATGMLRDDPELLAAERRRLAHVYVDELADTDPAQLELLDTVAGGGLPLVAFADPDSSTYAFRGADPGGVTSFPHRFRTASGAPAAQVLLSTSYRAASGCWPDAPAGTVEVRTFSSTTSEAAWLAHALRAAHLLDGVPWSRMAVLVRSTARQLPGLRRALHAAGVPTVVHGEDLPLHLQPAVAPLLLLLRCALEPEREAAVALLHSPPLGGADPLAERRLRQGLRALALARGDRRPSGELIIEALRDPDELSGVERRWAEPAQTVAGLLAVAREAADRPAATAEEVPGARQWPARAISPGVAGPRRPTVTWTPCWFSSTPPPGSPTGCRARVPRCSSTTCSVRSCRPTRSHRPPTGATPCGCSPRTRPRDSNGIWSRWPGCRKASGRICGCVAACSARSAWSTCWPAEGTARWRWPPWSGRPRRCGDDHEEQPSRFLYELGRTDDPGDAVDGSAGPPPPRPPDEPPPDHEARRRPPPECPVRIPTTGGGCARSPTTDRLSTTASRCG